MYRTLIALAVCLVAATRSDARTWTDATGKYKLDADLIARGANSVVLQRQDGSLATVTINELSADDKKYLETPEADTADDQASGLRTWTMASGLTVRGRVVGYGRRELSLVRRDRKLFVNDRPFQNLPEIYQRMLPKIVGHILEMNIQTPENLLSWSIDQRTPRRFTVEGVMLELENGEQYGVPFFLFSDADQSRLKPGWDRWVAAKEDSAEREREDLVARAQTREQETSNRRVSQLQMALLATAAGVTDMWEVYLEPARGVAAMPTTAIVPARNSQAAIQMALAKNPGYVAGPVRRLN